MTILTLQNTIRFSFAFILLFSISTISSAQHWDTPTLVANIIGGNFANSMKEISSRPAIAYYDAVNFQLVYIRANTSTGSSWPSSPVVVDTDWRSGNNSIDMEIVNGNPAIVSDSPQGKDIRYTRATNSTGTSWSTTVLAAENIATSYGGNLYLDLEIVSGNPAVAYLDGDNMDLYYVRANDANGTTWGTPILIASIGDVGEFLSMTIVSGRPAISYYNATLGDLMYVRANNSTGSSWGTPVTVSSSGNIGREGSLAVINGDPAIAYGDFTNLDLMYVKSNNSTGSSWDTPIQIASHYGEHINLLEVEGTPGIIYYTGFGTQDLNYTKANDSNGSNWTAFRLIDDNSTAIGTQATMAIINGNPAVAYRDLINNNLYYSRSLFSNGLPVELSFFNGTNQEKSNLLTWQTVSETNNEGFEIERSNNGENWERIGFVRGNGNSTFINDYQFSDESLQGNAQYYRLKQIDLDRKSVV